MRRRGDGVPKQAEGSIMYPKTDRYRLKQLADKCKTIDSKFVYNGIQKCSQIKFSGSRFCFVFPNFGKLLIKSY